MTPKGKVSKEYAKQRRDITQDEEPEPGLAEISCVTENAEDAADIVSALRAYLEKHNCNITDSDDRRSFTAYKNNGVKKIQVLSVESSSSEKDGTFGPTITLHEFDKATIDFIKGLLVPKSKESSRSDKANDASEPKKIVLVEACGSVKAAKELIDSFGVGNIDFRNDVIEHLKKDTSGYSELAKNYPSIFEKDKINVQPVEKRRGLSM